MAKRKKRLKKNIRFLLFILIVGILGFGIYKLLPNNKQDTNDTKVTTTKKNETNNKSKTVNLSLVGDIMYEGLYLDAVNAGENPDDYLKMVADKYFNKDDISIGNLETTITDNNKLKVNGYGYEFCSPQNVIKALDNNSIDVLGTTNNHSTDRGIDGINSTIDYLKNNTNIMSVGSYKSKEDRANLRIIEKNGVKVGFVAYALGMNDFGTYITENEAWRLGLYRKPPSYNQVSDEYIELMRQEIRELKKNVDVVVAIMHWGQEFHFEEREVDQIRLSKVLNEEHVDVVLGSHSHCFQPVKWYTSNDGYKTLVFYSMGNFTSSDPTLDNRASLDYVKAYQLALLANIDITIDNNKVIFNKVTTEPIINYYNSNKRNFKMIPLSEYTNEYESSHYLYNQGLTKDYINSLYNKIIPEEFR
jgi:poly-gamma-glutamate synthesis protein (capsule biosynthesis protein)